MNSIKLVLAAGAVIAAGACAPQATPSTDTTTGAPADTSAGTTADCPVAPLETRAANATGQTPAFPGQTRACGIESNVAHQVAVVATGLVNPWAVEPLPDGSFLVTERPGRMRHVTPTGQMHEIQGVPPVHAANQAGLLDVALSPDFTSDRTIFWSYAEPRQGGNGTSVARGVLSNDYRQLGDVRVILRTMPTYTNDMHYGSRLSFGPDGFLYVTTGERSDVVTRPQAQQLNSHYGKTLRITREGAPAPNNPFAGRQGALPEIWTYGHRNIQAATFDDRGRYWVVEHGTRGGDEINLIERGNNYGWPVQAYGIEYAGGAITSAAGPAAPQREGMTQPIYYWDPVIAPSGAEWYTGSAFPAWRNSLFVGGLVSMRLVRVVIDDANRVTGEEHLLVDRRKRIRDVRQGPDGNLYVVTDHENGELWRISPR